MPGEDADAITSDLLHGLSMSSLPRIPAFPLETLKIPLHQSRLFPLCLFIEPREGAKTQWFSNNKRALQ